MPTYRNNNKFSVQLESDTLPNQYTVKPNRKIETKGYYQIPGLELVSHEPIYVEVDYTYDNTIAAGTEFDTTGHNTIDVICTAAFSITYNKDVAGTGVNSGVENFAAGAHVQIDNKLNNYVNIVIAPLDVETRVSVNMRK